MLSKRKISRIIAAAMLLFAVGFVCYAFGHPTASFPWSNTVTYCIYAVYLSVTAVLFAVSFGKKK